MANIWNEIIKWAKSASFYIEYIEITFTGLSTKVHRPIFVLQNKEQRITFTQDNNIIRIEKIFNKFNENDIPSHIAKEIVDVCMQKRIQYLLDHDEENDIKKIVGYETKHIDTRDFPPKLSDWSLKISW